MGVDTNHFNLYLRSDLYHTLLKGRGNGRKDCEDAMAFKKITRQAKRQVKGDE